MYRISILILSLMLHFSSPAWAQNEEESLGVPAAPSPCSGAKYHQFDFWIGDWTVTANEQLAGTNRIQPIQDGCALQENWQGAGPGGVSGSSFNMYDHVTDQWHQTWVDSSGTLLQLDGGLVAGNMVLQGVRPAADGSGSSTHRITWTPNPDGSVRQLWEASTDGETWTVLFDGLYQTTPSENESE